MWVLGFSFSGVQKLAVIKKMKQLRYISIIGILILNRCSNSDEYKIEKNFKSVVDNENCQIEYYYPKFISSNPKIDASKINEILEKYSDTEHYARRCDEVQIEKNIIKGDFQVTLKTEDRLSIEFVTEIIQYGENRMDTVYHSLVLNPQKIDSKDLAFFQPDPESIFSNFDRGNLHKFVKKYNEEKNEEINLLAYESGSRYELTWGLSEKNFILYVGGEGECFGYDKIEIPINEIKKEDNR